MSASIKLFLANYKLTNLAAALVCAVLPLPAQADSGHQAQTTKAAIVRSCPNRLCPVVQTLPKGRKFYWILAKNGFVNIADSTLWVSTADIK
ncbi:hypothetical protein A9299_08385 [Moraxella osloensis]|uniref:SH3 domain-containing protein n=1 Tax=Faucicola osloensis TaxID=34062 RepID=A0AA91FR97_FAUOS|nr:hypothetical protein [Moraxella osloensis]OBX65469.1 hypothetical protein A9299_08385 [Moraxella osloensis]